MTAKDRWDETLRCPVCGKQGVAQLWQYDGWSFKDDQETRVSHVPEGFNYSTDNGGFPKFFCVEHPDKAA